MSKAYYTIFSLIGITVIIYAGVDLFYRIVRLQLSQMDPQKTYMSAAPEIKRKKRPLLRDYQVINSRNIFGAVDQDKVEVVEKEPEIEALEPTSLKIALLGTVAGYDKNAVAVIEETNKRKQGLFRVGDSVQNAMIKRILRGKVILRVGEKDEILTMDESTSKSTISSAGPNTTRAPQQAGDSTITLRTEDLQSSLANINSLLSQVRIRPYFKDGKAEGLSISRIRPNSLFAKLGLKNGDVVLGIDEQDIQSPDDIISFYQKLKSGSNITLQLNRGGQPVTLNYELR